MGFWYAVTSAGPHANNLHHTSLQTDNHLTTQFLPRDAMLARYICCRHVSICLSVRLSQAGIV